MFKICIRNSNSSNSCKTIFSSPAQRKFPLKKVRLISRLNWQVWRRMICIRRIVVVDNSQIIIRILICFATPLLQSNKSLCSTKHKAMARTGSKGWANQLTSHDVISSLVPCWFIVSGTFVNGKSSFWTVKIQEIFWETHFKSSDLLIKLNLGLKSISYHIQFKVKDKRCAVVTVNIVRKFWTVTLNDKSHKKNFYSNL